MLRASSGVMAQSAPEIFDQRIHIDVFRGHLDRMISVIAGTSLCLTGQNPVGCLVTGAAESLCVYECLQYVHGVAVFFYPVTTDTPGYPGEDMTGQVRNRDPRQNEEPCVIRKVGELSLTALLIPADKPIAGGGLPGRGAKKEARYGAMMVVINEISHILAHGGSMPQIVILRQKRGEEPMIIGCGLYRRNGERNKASQRIAYLFGSMRRRERGGFAKPVPRGALTGR